MCFYICVCVCVQVTRKFASSLVRRFLPCPAHVTTCRRRWYTFHVLLYLFWTLEYYCVSVRPVNISFKDNTRIADKLTLVTSVCLLFVDHPLPINWKYRKRKRRWPVGRISGGNQYGNVCFVSIERRIQNEFVRCQNTRFRIVMRSAYLERTCCQPV